MLVRSSALAFGDEDADESLLQVDPISRTSRDGVPLSSTVEPCTETGFTGGVGWQGKNLGQGLQKGMSRRQTVPNSQDGKKIGRSSGE